ncbi:MAG: VWA domain-containing protein [Candidatus Aminicenantes bacterium]|nr:VWA domain-containing protein [Candidatus Aminicenantes bacterium]NIM83134.1 VWA domain-containing protein [Candidatus Aminicenantes bacterium]NIN22514.1 VWA domain-containing protein [Candidatus Aminicenantes bacterium]NIN46282.1 VWA domain-containing protein [Candidatus Aminicenantes bacterium]NIN89120.1 VWA domain-containing protein [Candidatus Aminicenantes bacterium]
MDNKKAVLLFCLIVSLTITLKSQGVSGPSGFDFVVIVDQSGSMKGTKSTGFVASDALGVRNDMVKRAFELLATDGVLNKVTHRFGVISFGSEVRVDLPLSPITQTTVDSLRKRLNRNLSDISMGNTHFTAAFGTARRMFAAGPRADREKRVILLITDGAPYVEGINMSSYRRNLEELIKSNFPYPDYRIHVVALNDPSSNYWEEYRDFWRELSHNQARQLEGDKEHIFRALHELIDDILDISSDPVIDNPVIPPYLESVVFSIFRVDPEVEVKIFPVDRIDQALAPEDEGVTFVNVGRTIQIIAIKNPTPGQWQIKKSHEKARVDIYVQRFFPRGKLLHPDPDKPIKQFEKVFVKYRVEDGNHQPIEELPGYPLTLELTLVKPDDSKVEIAMEKSSEPSEKSVFRTSEAVECDLKGEYRTEVLIATKDFRDHQVTLFRDQWSKFRVEGARLISCNLLNPKPFENIPIFETLILIPKPLYSRFKFIDEDGDTLNLLAFFRGSPEDILTIYAVKGNREQTVPAKFEQQGSGILVASLKDLKSPGTHRLRFRVNHAVIPPNYTVRITPDELFFTRSLTLLHWLQIVMAGLLVFMVIAFVGYKLFINLRFSLKGRLCIDRLGKRTVAEYLLTQKRHRLVLKKFPNETMIKKMIIRSKRDKSGGVIVTVIGEKRKVFLKDRTLYDRSTATLKGVPYVLRFRLK